PLPTHPPAPPSLLDASARHGSPKPMILDLDVPACHASSPAPNAQARRARARSLHARSQRLWLGDLRGPWHARPGAQQPQAHGPPIARARAPSPQPEGARRAPPPACRTPRVVERPARRGARHQAQRVASMALARSPQASDYAAHGGARRELGPARRASPPRRLPAQPPHAPALVAPPPTRRVPAPLGDAPAPPRLDRAPDRAARAPPRGPRRRACTPRHARPERRAGGARHRRGGDARERDLVAHALDARAAWLTVTHDIGPRRRPGAWTFTRRPRSSSPSSSAPSSSSRSWASCQSAPPAPVALPVKIPTTIPAAVRVTIPTHTTCADSVTIWTDSRSTIRPARFSAARIATIPTNTATGRTIRARITTNPAAFATIPTHAPTIHTTNRTRFPSESSPIPSGSTIRLRLDRTSLRRNRVRFRQEVRSRIALLDRTRRTRSRALDVPRACGPGLRHVRHTRSEGSRCLTRTRMAALAAFDAARTTTRRRPCPARGGTPPASIRAAGWEPARFYRRPRPPAKAGPTSSPSSRRLRSTPRIVTSPCRRFGP